MNSMNLVFNPLHLQNWTLACHQPQCICVIIFLLFSGSTGNISKIYQSIAIDGLVTPALQGTYGNHISYINNYFVKVAYRAYMIILNSKLLQRISIGQHCLKILILQHVREKDAVQMEINISLFMLSVELSLASD